jgi:hypothetical protein
MRRAGICDVIVTACRLELSPVSHSVQMIQEWIKELKDSCETFSATAHSIAIKAQLKIAAHIVQR